MKTGNTRKTNKNMNIYTKRHLGYLRHFEKSTQTKTNGIYGLSGQHFIVCQLEKYVALANL
jgi:hypothetical protein